MKVTTSFVLDREDINRTLPYSLICMTRYGADWQKTSTRKRFEEEFTSEEREDAEDIFRKSHRWLLTVGVPEETRMTGETFALWLKLGEFCASV